MTARRLPVALTGAVIVALALFWVMQALIHVSDNRPVTSPQVQTLELIRVTAEPPPPPPPPRQAPQAPKRETPRPQAAGFSIAAPAIPTPAIAVPSLDLQIDVSGRLQAGGLLTGVAGGDALAAFSRGQQGFEGDDLVPVSSARPRYPRSAANRQIEGWVELIFVINGDGRVSDVRILDASPRGVFEDAAVHAMSRWLYPPFYVNGKPVAREATQLFRFRLEDIQDIYLWDD